MRIKSILAIGIRVFVSFLSFLLTYVVSRKLTIEDSSVFFIFLSLQSVILVFFTFGLTDYIIKNGSSVYTDDLSFGGFFLSCTLTVFLLSILTCFVFYLLSLIGVIPSVGHMFYMVISFIPISIVSLISSFFQAKKRTYESILVLGFLPVFFCFSTLFIGDINFEIASKLYLISSLLSFLLSFILFFKNVNPNLKCRLDFKFIKDTELFNMFFVQLLFQIFSQNTVLIMVFLGGRDEVSFLAVSLRVITCVSIVLLAINKVISSDLAINFKNNNINEVKVVLKRSSRLIIFICFPLICLMLLFPKSIMSIFGTEYVGYYNVLRILALGQIINVITGNVGLLLSMTGFVVYLRKSMLLGMVLSLSLSVILIPFLGVIGAAWCIAISTATINLMSVYYVNKCIGINMFKVLF